MKFISITDLSCANMAYNLYLQFKSFNLQDLLSIHASDDITYRYLKGKDANINLYLYEPYLYNKHIDLLKSGNKNQKYSLLQMVKHDIAAFFLDHTNDHVFIIDTDLIIFNKDFTIHLDHLFNYISTPLNKDINILAKIYLNFQVLHKPDTIHFGNCYNPLVNGGFIGYRNIPSSKVAIRELYKQMQQFDLINNCNWVDGCLNIDEIILTNYLTTSNIGLTRIPDWLNTLSDHGHVYSPSEVLSQQPMTYHTTFCKNKEQFIKDCNKWLVS